MDFEYFPETSQNAEDLLSPDTLLPWSPPLEPPVHSPQNHFLEFIARFIISPCPLKPKKLTHGLLYQPDISRTTNTYRPGR